MMLRACLALFLLSLSLLADAQTIRGAPLKRDYLPEDYGATPQHLALAVDAKGYLYVGNLEGLLRFDGDSWELIPLPGNNSARALGVADDGQLYIGSYDDFGLLERGPDMGWKYRSLREEARPEGFKEPLGIIWAMLPTREGVWVHAERHLLFFSHDRKRRQVWPLGADTRSFYLVDDVLYGRFHESGLKRFRDGRFELVPGGERFAVKRLANMFTDKAGALLVGDDGFYRMSAEGIAPIMLDGEHAGRALDGPQPYESVQLSDGSLLVGSLSGDLHLFDRDLRLRERLPASSFPITALRADHEGGVWIATEASLTRMELPSPWSFVGAAQGLGGTVSDSAWFRGRLYVAGSRGMYSFEPDREGRLQAQREAWVPAEAFSLDATPAGLLIGHREGLLVVEGDRPPRALIDGSGESVVSLHPSPFARDLRYALGDQNLYVLQLRDGQWRVAAQHPLNGMSPDTVHERSRGELWLGDYRGGPQRWRFDHASFEVTRRETFGAAQGLAIENDYGSFLLVVGEELLVVSGKRGFRFDGQRFHAFDGPPVSLTDKPYELQVKNTPVGTYAISLREMWLRRRGETQWMPVQVGGHQARGFRNLSYTGNGMIAFGTWSGLMLHDPAMPLSRATPLQLGFDRVSAVDLADGSRRNLPTMQSAGEVTEVPPGHRIFFRFALVSLQSKAEYRYRVIGLAEEWSPWSDRELYVRSATPGDYVLEVQARTVDGKQVMPTLYRFRVLPLWHEQWWVRALMLLIGLGVLSSAVVAYIGRRTQRYREENTKLERRIVERTRELEDVNRKLAELATEDPLTGALNRRALEQGLHREWLRCQDQQRPLSVLMIDVDHFKRYNDEHGHLEGDAQLQRIAARLMASHDPKRELFARYGGEEFCLLLPGLSLAQALERAEQLRVGLHQAMEEATVSVGVASVVPGLGGEPSSLLRRADSALYLAKRNGRNRVESERSV